MEALCQTQVFQTAEVAPELQLIRASAAFGRYVIKSSPELKNQVIGVMTAFVNNRVSPWLTKQGGWVSRFPLFFFFLFRTFAQV